MYSKDGQTIEKLVRDKIPLIMQEDGFEAITRHLDDVSFRAALLQKLHEETDEAGAAKDNKETLGELADILELVRSLARLCGSDLQGVEKIANHKRDERGGFENRVWLVNCPVSKEN